MIVPDSRVIHALNHIRIGLEFADFKEWLVQSRAMIYSQMESTSNTEQLHALRGEARALSSLLDQIAGSREASERLEATRKAR